jgi:hypothetical protein
METIVKLSYALDYTAHIHLTPNDVGCKWMHWVPTSPKLNYNEVFWSGYERVKSLEREVE